MLLGAEPMVFARAGQPSLPRCGAVCGGGVREGIMLLAQLSAHFQSLPPLPTSELCPSRCCPGADSWVGGLVYILGSLAPQMDYSERLTVSSATATPTYFYSQRLWGFIYPSAGTLGCPVCSGLGLVAPQFFLLVFIHVQMWDHPVHQLSPACPLCPGCPCPPLLPVCVNVSSFTPWLLDFLTVWFSGSSGCVCV